MSWRRKETEYCETVRRVAISYDYERWLLRTAQPRMILKLVTFNNYQTVRRLSRQDKKDWKDQESCNVLLQGRPFVSVTVRRRGRASSPGLARLLQGFTKLRQGIGLLDEPRNPLVGYSLDGVLFVVPAGENDLDPGPDADQLLERGHPVHVRHRQVEDDMADLAGAVPEHLHGIPAVRCGQHVHAEGLHHLLADVANDLLVIHHQYRSVQSGRPGVCDIRICSGVLHRRRLRERGEEYPDRAPSARAALDKDGAPVSAHDAQDRRHSAPAARGLGRGKRIEQPLLCLFVHAASRVGHFQHDEPAGRRRVFDTVPPQALRVAVLRAGGYGDPARTLADGLRGVGDEG